MPNWCSSTYAFKAKGKNKKELQRLHQTIAETIMGKTIPKEKMVENGFGAGWLGNVAIVHGIDWESVSCRGDITVIDVDVTGWGDADGSRDAEGLYYFKLETETAWTPTIELWDAVVKQYEGVSFVYTSEEQGCDIFINTDTEGQFFTQRYLLKISCDNVKLIPKYWSLDNVVLPAVDSSNSAKNGTKNLANLDIHEYFTCFDELHDYFAKLTGKEDEGFESLQEIRDYLDEVLSEALEANGSQSHYLMANIREFAYE